MTDLLHNRFSHRTIKLKPISIKDTAAMKINNNDQMLTNLYPEVTTVPHSPADKEFGTILKESFENVKTEDTGPHQTTFVNPLNGLRMDTSTKFDKQYALDRIENLIGMLDQYRHILGDSGITLKNIDSIIRKIDKEAENLAPVLDLMPEDKNLKSLINQTLVTASLEVTKFYRGDYITA